VEVLPGSTLAAGSARYFPRFIDENTADVLLHALLYDNDNASASAGTISPHIWQREVVVRGGQTHKVQRRRTCYFGAAGATYAYAGLTRRARPWDDASAAARAVSEIRSAVEERLGGMTFTFCICNLYEDGDATIGKHSDSLRDLEPNSVIASVSLGAARTFVFHKKPTAAAASDTKLNRRRTAELGHGSLLVMDWASQQHWLHELPKRAKRGPRVNLTFRTLRLPVVLPLPPPPPPMLMLLPGTPSAHAHAHAREHHPDDDDDGPPPLEPIPEDRKLLLLLAKRDRPDSDSPPSPEKRARTTGTLDAFFFPGGSPFVASNKNAQ
jgi:alkylated DNA repair dioxygenase AlkB